MEYQLLEDMALMDYKYIYNTYLWCLGFSGLFCSFLPAPNKPILPLLIGKKVAIYCVVKALNTMDCSGPAGMTTGLAFWDYFTRKDLRTKLPIR